MQLSMPRKRVAAALMVDRRVVRMARGDAAATVRRDKIDHPRWRSIPGRERLRVRTTISLRFLALQTLVAAATIAAAAVLYLTLTDQIGSAAAGAERAVTVSFLVGELDETQHQRSLELLAYVLHPEQVHLDALASLAAERDAAVEALTAMLSGGEAEAALRAYLPAQEQLDVTEAAVLAAATGTDAGRLDTALEQWERQGDQTKVLETDFETAAAGVAAQALESVRNTRKALLVAVILVVSIAVAAALLAFIVAVRLVARPLAAISAGAERIAEGDLTAEFDEAARSDEIGQLTHSLRSMTATMRGSHVELREANTGLQQEIRSRQRSQGQLAESNRALERSNRDLEEFARVAAHDLQEPLRKIRAYGDRLSRQSADVLDERGQGYLLRMAESATRMQGLIGDILQLSAIGAVEVAADPVDLNALAREVIATFEDRVEAVGATINVGDLPRVRGRASQLSLLLQNLLSNALKYTRPGVPPVITVDGTEHGESWMIRVRDNGIGFEPQYAERIFGVFQRLHSRDEYEGTGIGLANCRRIVERHGGSITAKSRLGQGATFTIRLPKHRGNQEPGKVAA